MMPGPASANLPPRPTEVPTAVPTAAPHTSISGASIELRVPTTHLDYYTQVQWQDFRGTWHTVLGWQGNLDDTAISNGQTFAYKRWWVYVTDFGQQDFRWLVYDRPNGKALVTSSIFNLPTYNRQQVIVPVILP
jgi:hypothetical protein